MELGELIAGLDVRAAGRDGERSIHPECSVRVCDITDDSRTVVPGSLFVARSGGTTDGNKYIGEALAAGAVAVLTDDPALPPPGDGVPLVVAHNLPATLAEIAERFYGRPSGRLFLVGITGTNGKTTAAHLIHQVLNGGGMRCGLIGTVVIDDGREVGAASMTTPPASELSRTFATMVEAGCRASVMETSSHALAQDRTAALRYRVGVFTNLTGDHLDYHGSMEEYGAAKARLFSALPADGWAVVNAEDPAWTRMVSDCRARVMRCWVKGQSELEAAARQAGQGHAPPGTIRDGVDCVATVLSMSMVGTRVLFEGPWGRFETTIRLVGRHNVMNALQAVAACHVAGLSVMALERQIGAALPPPGRLEPVTRSGDGFAAFVDYAHTDDALRQVLSTLSPLVRRDLGGRLAVVFGCGGDRDRTKRPRMGSVAAELADLVYITSDNPRSERPGDIIDEVLGGVPIAMRAKVAVDADRRRAICHAIDAAHPGDIVVIAGKGHETEQIVADGGGGLVRHHFDDREVARAAVVQRRQAAWRAPEETGRSSGPRAVRA